MRGGSHKLPVMVVKRRRVMAQLILQDKNHINSYLILLFKFQKTVTVL